MPPLNQLRSIRLASGPGASPSLPSKLKRPTPTRILLYPHIRLSLLRCGLNHAGQMARKDYCIRLIVIVNLQKLTPPAAVARILFYPHICLGLLPCPASGQPTSSGLNLSCCFDGPRPASLPSLGCAVLNFLKRCLRSRGVAYQRRMADGAGFAPATVLPAPGFGPGLSSIRSPSKSTGGR